ncbi:MAG: APC family permease, partial [Oscillospiraceae bacterium]|nr:APC family permease [Oscillospiraceae bacterium]
YSMSSVDAMPKWFGKLDPKTAVPKNAILFLTVLSLAAPFLGRQVINWVVDMTSVGASLSFAYSCATAMKLAKQHHEKKWYWIGLVGLILSIFFLGILLSCAVLLLKSWRRGKEEMHPLTPALFAALIFSMLHAALEVVYSASFYLPIVFAIFALIVLCCGEAVSVSGGKKTFVWAQRAYLAFVAVWIVFLGLNIYAKSITVQPSYAELITATKLDRYERNDYMLTYVYSMASDEERTAEGEAQMYEYMDRLEQVSSSTIPLYLAECYFNLDQTEKAFDMLRKFTAYTASDEEKWDAAYRKAAQFYDESEEFYNGLASLVKDMNAWNESHVGEIVLEADIANFIIQVLSK